MRIRRSIRGASVSMSRFDPRLISEPLEQRRREGTLRQRTIISSRRGSRITVDGREYVNFSSNDYLGLATSPMLMAAWREGAELWGAGSGASPLVTGMTAAHEELEQFICGFLGMEAALLFSSGFAANQAAVKTFVPRGGVIHADRLAHASLAEAAMLSGARLFRFRHNDPVSLRRSLELHGPGLIITEGVFSMDGDEAPLGAILSLADEFHAPVLLDDAHGFGVLGDGGRGSVSAQGLAHSSFDLVVGTFGKAFGTGGAFVAGERAVISCLVNFAREYVYSTHMPPCCAHATLAAMKYASRNESLRERLRENIAFFRERMACSPLEILPSRVSIQPVMAGSSARALAMSSLLRERGIFAGAIRPPTVPQGTARIRLSVTAAHTREDLELLASALDEAGRLS